jgi:hypothetical protein
MAIGNAILTVASSCSAWALASFPLNERVTGVLGADKKTMSSGLFSSIAFKPLLKCAIVNKEADNVIVEEIILAMENTCV